MKKCQLCHKEFVKLANAHIIPKCFVKFLQPNAKWLFVLNKQTGRQVRNTGATNTEILCRECDNSFSKYENRFVRFLKRFMNDAEKIPIRDKAYFEIDLSEKESEAIELTLQFILWKECKRRSRTIDPLSLGPYLNKIEHNLKEKKIVNRLPIGLGIMTSVRGATTSLDGIFAHPRKRKDTLIDCYAHETKLGRFVFNMYMCSPSKVASLESQDIHVIGPGKRKFVEFDGARKIEAIRKIVRLIG